MMKENNCNVLFGNISKYICFAIIIICAFLNIDKGLDLSDTGYSLVYYMDPFSTVNNMPTWGANIIGYFFVSVLQIKSLLHIRIVFEIIISITGIILWYVSKEHMNKYLAAISIGVGVLVSHYFPHTIAYIFISVCISVWAICLLYWGLTKEKYMILLLAGFVMGINIFVRFPNICYLIIGIAIIYWLIMKKTKFQQGLMVIMCVIGGGITALALGVVFLGSIGQLSNYFQSFIYLKEMGTGDNSHNIVFMLKNYVWDIIFWFTRALFIVIPMGIGYLCSFTFKLKKYLLYLVIVVSFGISVLIGLKYSLFFNSLSIVSEICMIIAFVIAICSQIQSLRLYASLCLLQFLSMPLGSDNRMAYFLTCSFLALPFLVYAVEQLHIKARTCDKEFKKCVSVLECCIVVVILIFIGNLLKGSVFTTFRDYNIAECNTEVKYDKLKGIKTSLNKAKAVEPVLQFLTDKSDKFEYTITVGSIPMMAYLIEKPSAVSSAWIDLESYSISRFEDDLKKISHTDEVWIIVAKSDAQKVTWDASENQHFEPLQEGECSEKIDVLLKFIEKEKYNVLFNDEFFTVYGIQE